MIKCCSLFSGSTGNSIYIGDENTNILIDAGVSCKKIEEALEKIDLSANKLNAILISHEHSDHIAGIKILAKKYNIPIYASDLTWKAIEGKNIEVADENKYIFNPDTEFSIGNLNILPFKIPHDAIDPCGFNVFKEDYKVTVATDIGHVTDYLVDKLQDSNYLIIESNHDVNMLKSSTKYPYVLKKRILGENGHLSNDTTADLVTKLANKGMKNFMLAHLSPENNFPELAYQTVSNSLSKLGVTVGTDINLRVAPRTEISPIFTM